MLARYPGTLLASSQLEENQPATTRSTQRTSGAPKHETPTEDFLVCVVKAAGQTLKIMTADTGTFFPECF